MIYLDRRAWGARADLPRRGHLIGAAHRTEIIIHHTAIAGADGEPNTWPDLAAVRAQMRALQVARAADLGADVPYSFVAFVLADGTLALCEGRGLDRTGAHTTDHNRSAFGIAFHGNFEADPVPVGFAGVLGELSGWLKDLRRSGYGRLGSVRPAGRDAWAHRDIRATLCPGRHLYDRLGEIRFTPWEDDEMAMDKATWQRVQSALQSLDPPLYGGKAIDGLPGRNTDTAVQAFERRMGLSSRGVTGESGDPEAGIWPATRELLFALTYGAGRIG